MWRAFFPVAGIIGCLAGFFTVCRVLAAYPLLSPLPMALLCAAGVAGLFGAGACGAWAMIITEDYQ